MKNVFAVIVTFHRPEMLGKCISSLLRQREYGLRRIHVIVNSSDAQTIDVINSFDVPPGFISSEVYDNPGPAGGFYYGLKKFLEEGDDLVWLMDDDIVVDAACLDELVRCSHDHEYVFPRVIKSDGQEVISYGWWGVLMARPLVNKAGLPIPDLFYWTEDTEYLQDRLIRIYNTPPFRCKTGTVHHLHLRNKKRPSWYYYYCIRNTLYYRGYIVGYNGKRIMRTGYLLIHSLLVILIREENKIKKMKLAAYGIVHGLRGKIGKLVDPAFNK